MEKPVKKIVFMHIPKTGGTALGEYFDQFFNEEEIARIYTNHRIKLPLKAALEDEKIKFIRGHFGFHDPLLEAAKRGEVFVFTFFRNPVNRLLSAYLHMSKGATARHKSRMKDVRGFADFLKKKDDFNSQTHFLSATQHVPVFLENVESAFAEACENVKLLNFVGFHQSLASDLKLLNKTMGWQPKNELQTTNKGGRQLRKKWLLWRYKNQIAQREKWDIALLESIKKAKR